MFKFLSWNKSKHVDILSMIWIQLVLTTSILVLIIMVMWYMICIEVLELYTWLSLGRPACMYRFSSCFWFCKYLCMHLSGRFFFLLLYIFLWVWDEMIPIHHAQCVLIVSRVFFFPLFDTKKKNVCKLGLKKGLVKEVLKLLTHTHSWDYV